MESKQISPVTKLRKGTMKIPSRISSSAMPLLASCMSLFFAAIVVDAHRSLPSGITCGSQFASPETALVIPNPAISWATYSMFTCEDPVQWFEASASANQELKFTVTVPVLDRFEFVRMSAVFLGPGLPPISPQDTTLPDSVRQYAAEAGVGGVVFDSPLDQSSCDHLTSEEMKRETTVKDGRCHFYEPFGGSNLWVVMDEVLTIPFSFQDGGGVYKIAVYEQFRSTAKASFACCDWPEDFATPFELPETECEVCGTNPKDNAAWTSLFYEQKTMEEFAGYPPLQDCLAADPIPVELPQGEQCPPLPTADDMLMQQPEGCVLGCSSSGECHSHNVFGGCVHVLDWVLEPKFGDAAVKNVVIFKGDTIKFKHTMEDGFVHDVWQLADDQAFEQCSFDGATNLAGVEDVAIGHDITFDEAGTYHFTCSIGCDTPVSSMTAESRQADLCHCTIGQKLTVEVKDPTEGLRCHSHTQTQNGHAHTEHGHTHSDHSHEHTDHHNHKRKASESLVSPLSCPEGLENARTVNNSVYGAMGEDECSEQCTSPMALSFMTGVELGSCIDLGFVFNPTMKTVRPAGSPSDVEVRVSSSNEMEESDCHCHSYEEIVCPENETPEDTLYVEHIDEIVEYCQGILDGTETDCPYKCFQPIEVLHLHYIECPSRPVDPIYAAVNATNLCHIAADAPAGTDECPVVSLAPINDKVSGSLVGVNDVDENDGEDSDSIAVDAAVVAVILGSVLLFFCYVLRCQRPVEEAGQDKDKKESSADELAETGHYDLSDRSL